MQGISQTEALELMALEDLNGLLTLFNRANAVRNAQFGNGIAACAILNAKSGCCTENCAFCPQSIFAESKIEEYPLMSSESMLAAAKAAEKGGAVRFGLVTSGRTISDPEEFEALCEGIRLIRKHLTIKPCGSLGILTLEQLQALKAAGLDRYHHNLETAGSHYEKVCTTRTYADQLRTVRDAKTAGLTVCSGGIFGLGESREQRVEMLQTLREEGVDSVPINFLNALEGTRMAGRQDLTPLECLKIIAVARLMLPAQRIRICGGREHNLRDLQSWIFTAGADSLMIGNYLTTQGRTAEKDFDLLHDLGLELVKD